MRITPFHLALVFFCSVVQVGNAQTTSESRGSALMLELLARDCPALANKMLETSETSSLLTARLEYQPRVCDCVTRRFGSDEWLKAQLDRAPEVTNIDVMKDPLRSYLFGRLLSSVYACASLELDQRLTQRQVTK
jgi:hypothetical protein